MTTVKNSANAGLSAGPPRYNGSVSKPSLVSSTDFQAAVLDLDGVITRTAEVHASAWQATFDEYLSRHHLYPPFDLDSDYRRYLDGKPRYDGVESFLASRNITLPYGEPEDSPLRETVCGIGNRKNQLLLEKLQSDGVRLYSSSVDFIQNLRRVGIAVAVASSSRNCRAILKAAHILNLFDASVDGKDLERFHLPGKPAPDMFSEALRRLRCSPDRAIGFEDAGVGIRALKRAGFARVIGVDRGDQAEVLYENGADWVVPDLNQMVVARNDRGVP